MKRLFLAMLLLVLLSLSVPALKERAIPKYEAGASWLWGVVEPRIRPALTPFRKMRTQSEMAQIVGELIRRRNVGIPPPDPNNLAGFTRHAGIDTTATDIWGTPYEFRIRPDSVFLRSAGPDGDFDTDDDMLEAVRYASPYRLRRFPR